MPAQHILEPGSVEKMVHFADEHLQVASIAPRLMRLENNQKTNTIDSLGLKITRSRQVLENGAGKSWSDYAISEPATPVFGVSAAVVLYRRSAVIKANGLFDPDYFAYKEDVDLTWRLQLMGCGAVVLNDVVAYHNRSGRPADTKSASAVVDNKKIQSPILRHQSYKNHLALLKTNEQWQNALLDFPWILWYEVKKLVYFLLFDQQTLKGLFTLWQQRKKLRQKRKLIQQAATVSWQQMRQWWK